MSDAKILLLKDKTASDADAVLHYLKKTHQSVLEHSLAEFQAESQDQVFQTLSQVVVVVICLQVFSPTDLSIFAHLDRLLKPETLVFLSADTVMVSEIASHLIWPERWIGFSGLGLLYKHPHITLAAHLESANSFRQAASAFWSGVELPTHWIQETPGMVLPRVYAMLANEAAYAVQSGVATAADIDTAMQLGTNYPQGPLVWADHVGLDRVVAILDGLWRSYHEERYRVCLLLRKMVSAEQLGISTGQGFHTYRHHEAKVG